MENNLLEQILLGSILQNNDNYELVSDILEWKYFSNPHHQIFYKEIQEKLQKGSVANVITLSGVLQKHNINNDYLIEVSGNVTTSDHLKDYANIIRELFIRREAILLGDFIKTQAQDESFLEKGIYKIEEKLYGLSLEKSQQKITISFQEGLIQVKNTLQQALINRKRIMGITSGFIDVDSLIGGFRPGDLYIIAARPSMGKSAFAINIAVESAMDEKYGGPVAFISLEMPYNQIIMRIMSSITNIPLSKLINGYLTNLEFSECVKKLEKLEKLPLYIHDTSMISIGEIRTLLRQLKRKWNIKLAIIDYLQLIHGGNPNENRVAEVSRITRLLKSMAKELHLPIIALSQLSRSVENNKKNSNEEENHKPQLWHLRESGSIEQDADVVLFLLRMSYYSEKSGKNDEINDTINNNNNLETVYLYCDKNRNGATGKISLYYQSNITCFKNFINY